MANPFDAFDKDENPFDSFDEKKEPPKSGLRQFGDAVANTAMFGPVGMVMNAAGASGIDPRLSGVGTKALTNLPGNAAGIAKDLWHAVTSPVETARGVGDMVGALASQTVDPYTAAAVAQSSPENQAAYREAMAANKAQNQPVLDAMKQGVSDAYGGYDQIVNRMETKPLSMAMDLSTFAPVASPINATARGVGAAARVPEAIASHALGVTTGAGTDSVRLAAKAGLTGNKAFYPQLTGVADINQPVELARSSIGQMGTAQGSAYRQGMKGVLEDKSHLDFNPVLGALSNAQKTLHHGGIPDDAAAVTALNRMRQTVEERRLQPQPANVPNAGYGTGLPEFIFGDAPKVAPGGGPLPAPSPHYTPEGFDRMKRALGAVWRDTEQGTNARRVAGNAYNAAKDEIVKQAPVYAETMAGYSKAQDAMDEIARTLSLGEKATQDTALRKLQSMMRDTVASNFRGRKKLGEELAKYEPDLPYALAGQAMNSPIPRGLTGRGLAIMEAIHAPWLLPFTSPRAVGQAAYTAGQIASPIQKAWNAASPSLGLLGSPLYQAGNADDELKKRGLLWDGFK